MNCMNFSQIFDGQIKFTLLYIYFTYQLRKYYNFHDSDYYSNSYLAKLASFGNFYHIENITISKVLVGAVITTGSQNVAIVFMV